MRGCSNFSRPSRFEYMKLSSKATMPCYIEITFYITYEKRLPKISKVNFKKVKVEYYKLNRANSNTKRDC